MVRADSSVGVEVSGRLGCFALLCSASHKSRSNPVVFSEPSQVMCGDRAGKASINKTLHLPHLFCNTVCDFRLLFHSHIRKLLTMLRVFNLPIILMINRLVEPKLHLCSSVVLSHACLPSLLICLALAALFKLKQTGGETAAHRDY